MTPELHFVDRERFAQAIQRIDEENSRDPNPEIFEEAAYPRELLYARWLTEEVVKLCPEASEELLLAARCQHLCRWLIPRQSYPMTRVGYLQWRESLKKLHAQRSGEILREVGYPQEIIGRVQSLNLKKNFPDDPQARVLEDALCLVFLRYQLSGLAAKTTEDKVITALQKSWKKMTPAARAEALTIPYGPRERELLNHALNPG